MITIYFEAANYNALREQISGFLLDSAPNPVPFGNMHVKPTLIKSEDDAYKTLTYSNDVQAEAQSVVAQLTQPEVTQPAPLEPAQIVEEQVPIPEETQTEQPTDSASSASPPLTFEEVRLATLQLASKRGREAVMAVLEPYNVKRSSEVSEDLWPELIAKLEAAQNDISSRTQNV